MGGGGAKCVVTALLAVLLSAHISFADVVPAFTVGASDGTTSVVDFGGQQWWVIGQNTDTVRLWLKTDSTSTGYDSSYFRSGTGNTYDGTYTSQPNEYADSTLQRTIEGIADALPGKEQAVIQARTSADLHNDVDTFPGLVGGNTHSAWVELGEQKLWALSYDEWRVISGVDNEDAANFTGKSDLSGLFWLRSPCPPISNGGGGPLVGLPAWNGGLGYLYVDEYSLGVRPAFDLDLTNVAGYATVDGGYKFTFADESLNIGGINGDGTLNLLAANTLLASLNGTAYTLTGNGGLFDLNTLDFGGLSDGEYGLLLTAYEKNGNLFSDFVGNEFSQTVWIQNGALLLDAPQPQNNATPEPATMLILGLGLAGLGLARRRMGK